VVACLSESVPVYKMKAVNCDSCVKYTLFIDTYSPSRQKDMHKNAEQCPKDLRRSWHYNKQKAYIHKKGYNK